MLGRALVFFMVGAIVGAFGFGGLVGFAATIAKILCVVFLSLSVVSLFLTAIRGLPSRMRPR
jgi:uncharacterized membrane protein YtjA (UPF0391 family)